jgi:hypothetical protein
MPVPHADNLPVSKRGAIRVTTTHGFRMRFILQSILLCCSLCFVSATASAIEGLPGSTWGNATDSFHGYAPSTGWSEMTWINQGIDWFTLPGGITVNTYGEYRYRHRIQNKQYYDAQGPALGLEFKWTYFRLGTDYYWEKLPSWPGGVERSNNREYYLTGYYAWDLNKATGLNTSKIGGFPGGVWFNATYDAKGLTGSGFMGWINQGIDWATLPGGIVFNTFAEYRFRERTKQFEYYDAQGPAAGITFRKSVFTLGLDYYWETDPELHGDRNYGYYELFLTWYIDWDLKHRVPKTAVSNPTVNAVPEPVQPPGQPLPVE